MGDMIKDAAKHFKAALSGSGNDLKTFSSQIAYLPPLPLPSSLSTQGSSEKTSSSSSANEHEKANDESASEVKSPPPSLIVQLRSENMANKAKDIKLFALLEVESNPSPDVIPMPFPHGVDDVDVNDRAAPATVAAGAVQEAQ